MRGKVLRLFEAAAGVGAAADAVGADAGGGGEAVGAVEAVEVAEVAEGVVASTTMMHFSFVENG